jgi:hypothetical protein
VPWSAAYEDMLARPTMPAETRPKSSRSAMGLAAFLPEPLRAKTVEILGAGLKIPQEAVSVLALAELISATSYSREGAELAPPGAAVASPSVAQ